MATGSSYLIVGNLTKKSLENRDSMWDSARVMRRKGPVFNESWKCCCPWKPVADQTRLFSDAEEDADTGGLLSLSGVGMMCPPSNKHTHTHPPTHTHTHIHTYIHTYTHIGTTNVLAHSSLKPLRVLLVTLEATQMKKKNFPGMSQVTLKCL